MSCELPSRQYKATNQCSVLPIQACTSYSVQLIVLKSESIRTRSTTMIVRGTRKKIVKQPIGLVKLSTIFYDSIALQQYYSLVYHARMTVGSTRSFVTGAQGFPSIIGATNPPPNPTNSSIIELFRY